MKWTRSNTPYTAHNDEHKPIEIERGNYIIGIVKEYDHFSEEAREVMD